MSRQSESSLVPSASLRRLCCGLLLVGGLGLSVTGCRLHTVTLAPATLEGAVSPPIGSAMETSAEDASTAHDPWWKPFESATLDSLIRRALAENHDVEASRERLNQALALRRRASAGLWPQLEAEAGLEREVYARGREARGTERRLGATLDWDLDLFGRSAYAREARAAEAWARLYQVEAFRLNLSVDVAQTYLAIVEQRRLISLLGEQLGTASELSHIIEQRYKEGLISKLDVLQQQTQVAELESQLPAARASLEDLQNRLGALLGALPSDDLAGLVDDSVRLPEVGVIAQLDHAEQLLRRRPDLRAAQAALVAADAETGRALAERLPALTLTADVVRVAGGGDPVTVTTIGGEIVQPLLDWGARRAEWVRAGAVYRERLADFSQQYVDAVWEVRTLVQNEFRQRELLETLARRRALLEATIKQARSRYDAGLTDYLPVLSATQQFYSVEQRLLREHRRLASLRVSLHRSLGGPMPEDTASVRPDPLAKGRITVFK